MGPAYNVPVFFSYYHILLHCALQTSVEVRAYLTSVGPSTSISLAFHAEEVLSSLRIYRKEQHSLSQMFRVSPRRYIS